MMGGARGEEILDGGGGRREKKGSLLFRFHLFPFPPEMPDTQARLRYNMWTYSDCYTCICVAISFFY